MFVLPNAGRAFVSFAAVPILNAIQGGGYLLISDSRSLLLQPAFTGQPNRKGARGNDRTCRSRLSRRARAGIAARAHIPVQLRGAAQLALHPESAQGRAAEGNARGPAAEGDGAAARPGLASAAIRGSRTSCGWRMSSSRLGANRKTSGPLVRILGVGRSNRPRSLGMAGGRPSS